MPGRAGTGQDMSPVARDTVALAALRSVASLMLREMSTRYGRTPGGYLWAVVEPLGMILILGFVWSLLVKVPSLGTSFILFKATGMLILQLCMTISNQVGRAMIFSKPLLFYPRVTWLDAVFARFMLNGLVTVVVGTIILAGIIMVEGIRTPLAWGPILVAVTLTAAMGLGLGLLNCYLFQRIPVWEQIWAILTRPLFLISGVVVLYEEMPGIAQNILWYNPVLHLTGIMRDGFYPLYRPDYISYTYIGLWVLVPMLIGLLLMRQYHRDLLNI
jgi:capsular polysaccharide transport system permease protein